ncbi:MAG: hypothetical protein KGI67_00600 [Pseudomonadota bacterium]|nr:hypothetical protein [Pseudomonadota bacterium]
MSALLAWALPGYGAAGEPWHETVLHVYPVGPRFDDRWRLLEIALSHVAEHPGQYRLLPYEGEPTQRRAFALLADSELDVLSYGSTPEREQGFRPVRIDLLRGMLGYRVLLARSSELDRIAHLDLDALRKTVRYGGASDTQQANLAVMQANGFTTDASARRERMYDMLAAGRFDAYLTGLNELATESRELQEHHNDVARVPGLAFFYPFPVYFWVRRDNAALARLIERGLRASLADGSFRREFEASHADAIALVRSEPQRVIRLDNPLLPPAASETVDPAWWWPTAAGSH